MPEASLHAQIRDLLGGDPDSPRLPTVAQARRRCPPGAVMACRRGGRELVLVTRADGRAVLAPDRCPHDGGPLSDGFVDGDQLVCARHGWSFDLDTGARSGGPDAARDRPSVRLALESADEPARSPA
ncbi:Rieske (2Fe-2S) protein [Haliangium sp.]|uniref:Rieske (2Fe-2S) protein n=1 Tax=Haliangium sp. TaxID=2663208 RepID=UPI003D0DD446